MQEFLEELLELQRVALPRFVGAKYDAGMDWKRFAVERWGRHVGDVRGSENKMVDWKMFVMSRFVCVCMCVCVCMFIGMHTYTYIHA